MTLPAPDTDDAPVTTRRRGAADDIQDTLIEAKAHSVTSAAVTINRPREELYAFWRNLSNIPTFMENVEAIDTIDERRSHWQGKAPAVHCCSTEREAD